MVMNNEMLLAGFTQIYPVLISRESKEKNPAHKQNAKNKTKNNLRNNRKQYHLNESHD